MSEIGEHVEVTLSSGLRVKCFTVKGFTAVLLAIGYGYLNE